MRRNCSPSIFAHSLLSAAVTGALAGMAHPALAQTAEPTVLVTKPATPVKNDVSATNGSAADALNNVPSVAVDPDGTVTLRGRSNVQILIDGKPSAMLQGDNRAAALNALPADDIESVEVINNPGAQFGNEGGGGPILNLVMRRNRKPGGFAAINANAGSAGRYNSALSGSYNTGRFGVQGGANFRHDGRNSEGDAERVRIDPISGVATRSTQVSHASGLTDSSGFNSALTYNLGDKDTVGATLAYSRRSNDQQSDNRYVSFGAGDVADRDYVRATRRSGDSDSYSWGAKLDHKGAISGELAKLDLRMSGTTNDNDSAYSNVYAIRPPGMVDTQSRQDYRTGTKIVDFTGDYERPGEQGFLKLGYKVASHKNSFDTRFADIDPVTLAEMPNALRSNRFELDETTLALYGSYQLRLGEYWGVLAGLRTEYTNMDIAQLTSATDASKRYLNYIPSLFVSYKASDISNIRLSYAHRIRRPNAGDLNPFVVYRDEFNVSSGNPNLKPTETDSFELGYETRYGTLDTNLRGYYRKDTGLISERKVFISDTVLLTTRDNEGSNQSGGLEFTLSGKILPGLSLNTSGNLAYTEQRIYNAITNTETTRNAQSLSGRARFNYQLSDADQLQVSLNAQGKTLFGEGYRQPNSTANFSFRHALSPALNLVVNVTDVFNTNKIETITDTDLLKETNIRRYDGRLLYVGLSYRLGGVGPGSGAGRRGPGRS